MNNNYALHFACEKITTNSLEHVEFKHYVLLEIQNDTIACPYSTFFFTNSQMILQLDPYIIVFPCIFRGCVVVTV